MMWVLGAGLPASIIGPLPENFRPDKKKKKLYSVQPILIQIVARVQFMKLIVLVIKSDRRMYSQHSVPFCFYPFGWIRSQALLGAGRALCLSTIGMFITGKKFAHSVLFIC